MRPITIDPRVSLVTRHRARGIDHLPVQRRSRVSFASSPRSRARGMGANDDGAHSNPPRTGARGKGTTDGDAGRPRGFSFTKREFTRRFKRMTVGSASKKAKRTAKRWRAVHRGNRIGRAERDAVTNHLGLCLQVAFTAQSEAREAYERSVGDVDGEVGAEAKGVEAERPSRCRIRVRRLRKERTKKASIHVVTAHNIQAAMRRRR